MKSKFSPLASTFACGVTNTKLKSCAPAYPDMTAAPPSRTSGFTLIELLTVMAIIAILLTIAVPRYFNSVDRSKAVALRQNLSVMRDAIDKFQGDTGAFPETLDELVTKHYLRAVPVDPITESAVTWQIVPPPDPKKTGVYDVKSGAEGKAPDGSNFSDW